MLLGGYSIIVRWTSVWFLWGQCRLYISGLVPSDVLYRRISIELEKFSLVDISNSWHYNKLTSYCDVIFICYFCIQTFHWWAEDKEFISMLRVSRACVAGARSMSRHVLAECRRTITSSNRFPCKLTVKKMSPVNNVLYCRHGLVLSQIRFSSSQVIHEVRTCHTVLLTSACFWSTVTQCCWRRPASSLLVHEFVKQQIQQKFSS
jgi:hypothetical protein